MTKKFVHHSVKPHKKAKGLHMQFTMVKPEVEKALTKKPI